MRNLRKWFPFFVEKRVSKKRGRKSKTPLRVDVDRILRENFVDKKMREPVPLPTKKTEIRVGKVKKFSLNF